MSLVRVVHTTAFTYGSPVTASYNEARMRPVDDGRQTVRSARVTVSPHTWTDSYRDYWGTAVTIFEVLKPHEHLEIVADSTVEVSAAAPDGADAPGWEELGSAPVLDAYPAFLAPTSTTAVPDDVAALALDVASGLAPGEAAEAICRAVRDRLDYVPGVTTVHSPASDAWRSGQGVCQDMAHLGIGALRSVGIPARYVSGYLHPQADAEVGVTVVGESHAWLEWWVGRWVAYDPTNRRFAGDDHVVVGRGRQYGDVPPLKGVYAGPGASDLEVTVEMTRLA
ncbi:transglutaminase-like putative cysteine protease [Isoptericola jiangsuensis]|uniref:Transglutaminase-like putative cysteine protease n=1 Tax=Isoptericola jiangsuensis TaxID=548579 RepID=A0A2A9EWY0_9MICO|nr:transglutaminase family protein [Isoptericola jiangsuensis]PFG43647.1 transglutaminase-like putative cysteine protease [Isoptericola jiangsuensis]